MTTTSSNLQSTSSTQSKTTSIQTSSAITISTTTSTSPTSSLTSSLTTTGPLTTSSTTASSTAGGPLSYTLSVTCYGSGFQCWYGGTITWPSNACTDGCYNNILGGFTGNLRYTITLPACQDAIQWSFSPEQWAPVTLLVTISAPDGTVVQAEYATMYSSSDSISNSYLSCSPATSATTTTVIFPSHTTTNTVTTTYLLQTSVVGSVTFYIKDRSACGTSSCSYYALWGASNLPAPILNGNYYGNQTDTISLTCNDYLTWTFTLYNPSNVSAAQVVFLVKSTNGTVLVNQSTTLTNAGFQGTWRPSCSYATSTTTITSIFAANPSISGIVMPGFMIGGLLLAVSTFVSFRLKKTHHLD